MKRSTDNRRSPAEIKADLHRNYGGLEHSNAAMTDFRRTAYSVRHPKSKYSDTQNMSTAAALIRAQGEQVRRVTAEEAQTICADTVLTVMCRCGSGYRESMRQKVN